ncbi:substrate-binding domain-containing protein [Pseudomonas sp. Pseusp122]|uniref:substrate-binding domain-containing protein n=1 Tax=unclassified Pseudomonas TaxID=196821 RepID=UPI0039A5BFC9
MKQWLTLALSAGLCVTSLAQAATPLLGVGMAKYDDNFQSILRNGVQKHAAVLQADLFMENGENNVDLQMRQFRNLVNSKVDAIVVAMVNGKSAAEMMRLATAAKIPLVFINRNPDPEKWPAQTAFVGSNELESGTLQMEELARRANYKGNVVILIGDPSNKSSLMRTEDVEKVVAKYPNMKVVQKKVGNWERSQAATILIEWVKQGVDFSIVAANNDEMAIGAIMGLEKAGKNAKDYWVGGIDGTPDGLKLMADGKMAVSVFQDAVGQANGAVEAALRLARGEVLDSPVIWVPFKLITPENRQQFVSRENE